MATSRRYSTNASASPTLVAGNLQFQRIDATYTHACGVTGPGEARCWGQNLYGEIGNGTTSTTTYEVVPVKVGP